MQKQTKPPDNQKALSYLKELTKMRQVLIGLCLNAYIKATRRTGPVYPTDFNKTQCIS